MILSAALCVTAGCASSHTEATSTSTPTPMSSETIAEYSVWSAYWDKGNEAKLDAMNDTLDRVMIFAAYFQNEQLFVPDESKRLLTYYQAKERPFEVWLTVVNDHVTSSTSTQKDTDILWQLFENEETMEAHAQELVRLANQYSCDGIEIDYEKIRSDMDLWQQFLRFEEILLEKAEDNKLGVRIVLEPSTPIEELQFPSGAEYVVMCYNLHGYGTKPGPKADYAFLKSIFETFSGLENVSFALANGGFQWENGNAGALSVTDAIPSAACRDEESGALVYEDDAKTIWYADEETLRLWADYLETLAGQPVKISLWKI